MYAFRKDTGREIPRKRIVPLQRDMEGVEGIAPPRRAIWGICKRIRGVPTNGSRGPSSRTGLRRVRSEKLRRVNFRSRHARTRRKYSLGTSTVS